LPDSLLFFSDLKRGLIIDAGRSALATGVFASPTAGLPPSLTAPAEGRSRRRSF
jgi:hypothetical protein